jgi:hypothetical protein
MARATLASIHGWTGWPLCAGTRLPLAHLAVDMPTKFVTYTAIGALAVTLVPVWFKLLQI